MKSKQKRDFRKESLVRLKNTGRNKGLFCSKVVAAKLYRFLKKSNIKTLLLYLPLNSEVDTTQLIKSLRKSVKIYVPFMESVSFKLVKYRLPVHKNGLHVLEPQNSFAKVPKIDVAVVPVVGVDGNLRRIGFGKGMYDRFFASLQPKPFVIFVQLAKCFTFEVLCESYDVQADMYITPTDTMIRRGNNVFRVRDRSSGGGGHRGDRVCCGKKIGQR